MAFLIISICGLLALAGFTLPTVALIRHGRQGFLKACPAVPGVLLTWGWFSAYYGIAERQWTIRSIGFWIAVLLGCAGAWLIYRAGRIAFARRRTPDQCEHCGYVVGPLIQCPECGRSHDSHALPAVRGA